LAAGDPPLPAKLPDTRNFRGAVIDTGATRSVIGLPEARRYCEQRGVQLELKISARQYKFGDDVRQSIGLMQIQIPTPDSVLNISVDVVDMDVPLLIGLDVLVRYRLQVLTIDNVLQHTPLPGHGRS
jgi:hypothetical protein